MKQAPSRRALSFLLRSSLLNLQMKASASVRAAGQTRTGLLVDHGDQFVLLVLDRDFHLLAAEAAEGAALDHGAGADCTFDAELEVVAAVLDVDQDLGAADALDLDHAEFLVVVLVLQDHLGQAEDVHEVEREVFLKLKNGVALVVLHFDVEGTHAGIAELARAAVRLLLRFPLDFVTIVSLDLDFLLVLSLAAAQGFKKSLFSV
eukprot:CAMPEP_0116940728 /NCGR_PEP_ID=MMETSP0467-20121206/33549_1 /TAXON_ID=283647 /ORGANISM="Mesodinium pulex, Strain SPMC105" /LENGTH=204 /DNA_ID=CAMNT_0004623343 /DNA_START=25 /DNA_END=638 /DNA_ORIENTATION=+